MNIMHYLTLAIIQGFTEFLPISSSAHLIFIPELLDWGKHSLNFDIAVHFGTLLAVLIYFRDKITTLLNPFNQLTKNLIIATLPVCIIGLLTKPFIESYLRGPIVIAIATILFGLLLGYSQYKEKSKIQDFSSITYTHSFLIGLAQCLALVPGTSRAGITITAALFLAFNRKTAAEFSFLLSMPTIFLAGMLMLFDLYRGPELLTTDIYSSLIGFVCSAIIAMLTMNVFINLVERIGMIPFVIYRLILGAFLLYVFL